MKLSFNWLRQYVAHDLTPLELADLLTMAGLEVDEVVAHGPSLDGVVVGHVLEARPHPNADRLTLCTVDIGADEPAQIVCGAPNVAAGQRVAVAKVGTTLHLPAKDGAGTVAVTLDRRKIRGEVSEGMICAEDELGLGTDHSGIMVLRDDAPVGEPFEAYLSAQGIEARDHVLDVSITPNRPDATSHLGVARDVSALADVPLQRPDVTVPDDAGGEAAEKITVEIDAPEACPRYVAFRVEGVHIGPSPGWLKARLESIGLRPRSNVVDVTNFVMHECGQPLHAFDADRLAGDTIRVRLSAEGESFTTLDSKERLLPTGTLLICDAERPVAIAGVMGGENSEVTGATTNVLIESAYFDPSTVRRAAKALGLQTDASYRFERGVDRTGQVWAAARAAALIAELGGGRVVPGYVDAHPSPYEPLVVDVRLERVAALLGFDVPDYEIKRLLEAIGFVVEEVVPLEAVADVIMMGGRAEDATETTVLRCTVPPFRPDVAREVDVIEEIARLWGYDRIPAPTHLALPAAVPHAAPVPTVRAQARETLTGLGFRETYTNSLLPRATADVFCPPHPAFGPPEGLVAETLNPVSQDMAALRASLLPGVLGAVAYNQHRGQDALRLFEIGHVVRTGDAPDAPVPGYHEQENLLLLLAGEAVGAAWNASARPADFFDLKGAALHVLDTLGVHDVRTEAVHEPLPMAPYRLDVFAGREPLGFIAPVSEEALRRFDARGPVFFAEFNFSRLAQAAIPSLRKRFEPFTRFPAVSRDLAFVLPSRVPAGAVLETITQAGGKLLSGVTLFDRYEGDRIEAGHTSLAFGLRFEADRTLRDEEVDKAVQRIVKAVAAAHDARLRG